MSKSSASRLNYSWDSIALYYLFRSGTLEIKRQMKALNAIDVFPVPVGSAGTQIFLTLSIGCIEAKIRPYITAGEIAKAFADGTLMGLRGHQSVPFTQWFRGFAQVVKEQSEINGSFFANALKEAADSAYRGERKPINGEMWTVAKDIANVVYKVASPKSSIRYLLNVAIDEAYSSVARTNGLIPTLQRAGVVHSGGLALLCFLNGMEYYLAGEITENLLTDSSLGIARK